LPAGAIGEYDAKRILAAAGIPILGEVLATSAAEAAAAGKLGDRLVLKIVSPEITHKTEIGGVMLDVPAAEAGAAYDRLVARVKERAPNARLDGVIISPMVRGGTEMILGVQNDAVFGPVVMLGLGGIFVEVLRDVTFRIAPFGVEEARNMIAELRGAAILKGARGQPPADTDALAETVSNLSLFAAAHKHRLRSVDVNPLLVRSRGQGVAALDALIIT
jgi:succinyl-CoA synthetase beta subunit